MPLLGRVRAIYYFLSWSLLTPVPDLDINNPPEVKLSGWLSACDPISPAWKDPVDWDADVVEPPTKKTFIYKHREAMDPCLHPSSLLLHGQFLSHNTGPVAHRKMVPQFAYCTTMMHHDITTAMPINWVQDILPRSDDPPWEQKTDDRLQWRGSNTGIWHAKETKWRNAQRGRLVLWATHGYGGNITVLPPPKDDRHRVGEGRSVKKSRYGPSMLDIAFAGAPLNCPAETCDILNQVFEYRKQQNIKTAGSYKYILDVSARFHMSVFLASYSRRSMAMGGRVALSG
jgi:hypothetical protein